MSSSLKPIQVHGQYGPNPPKVAMVLSELDIPYEFTSTQRDKIKEPEFLAVNPNGRLPAIYDPNTDITLWESGAIVEYLVETYDKENKLGFPKGSKESFQAKQWLFFQVSGQGPYYGQAFWFKHYHPEPVPSAVTRYLNEIKRVTGVVESHLKQQKEAGGEGPWLVGNRFSYADLAWVPWQKMFMDMTPKEEIDFDDYPLVQDWIKRLGEQKGIKKVLDIGMMPPKGK